jgi:hypothetical protein
MICIRIFAVVYTSTLLPCCPVALLPCCPVALLPAAQQQGRGATARARRNSKGAAHLLPEAPKQGKQGRGAQARARRNSKGAAQQEGIHKNKYWSLAFDRKSKR